jgi:DNA-binding ferritin-like protein
VQGRTFIEDHEFFGDLYEDLDEQVDQNAEWIRMEGVEAPAPYEMDYGRSYNVQEVGDIQVQLPDGVIDQLRGSGDDQVLADRIQKLKNAGRLKFFEMLALNQQHIASLNRLRNVADESDRVGVVNGAEDLIQEHDVYFYFMASTLRRL